MSKKDFIFLADFFAREENNKNKKLIEDFADYLNQNNNRFDKEKFLQYIYKQK